MRLPLSFCVFGGLVGSAWLAGGRITVKVPGAGVLRPYQPRHPGSPGTRALCDRA
jgi:hypothetical protein